MYRGMEFRELGQGNKKGLSKMRNIYALEVVLILVVFIFSICSIISFHKFNQESVILEGKKNKYLTMYQKNLIDNFDDYSFYNLEELDTKFLNKFLSQ